MLRIWLDKAVQFLESRVICPFKQTTVPIGAVKRGLEIAKLGRALFLGDGRYGTFKSYFALNQHGVQGVCNRGGVASCTGSDSTQIDHLSGFPNLHHNLEAP